MEVWRPPQRHAFACVDVKENKTNRNQHQKATRGTPLVLVRLPNPSRRRGRAVRVRGGGSGSVACFLVRGVFHHGINVGIRLRFTTAALLAPVGHLSRRVVNVFQKPAPAAVAWVPAADLQTCRSAIMKSGKRSHTVNVFQKPDSIFTGGVFE